MGSKYANLLVHTTNSKGITQYLNQGGIKAYILPQKKRYIQVCEEKCDGFDLEAMSELANTFSRNYECVAFGVINFDDDILWYLLYSNGQFLDEYRYDPETASEMQNQEVERHAKTLCEAFGQVEKQNLVQEILSANSARGYFSQSNRHIDLGEALGWPVEYIHIGYSDLLEVDEQEQTQSRTSKIVGKKRLRQLTDLDQAGEFNFEREIKKLIRQKRLISAIILYQQHEMCSLKEAEQYIRSLGAF